MENREKINKIINFYEVKDKNLNSLGFDSYTEYLNSDLWKQIRAKMLNQYPRCFGCDRVATEVYQKDYSIDTLKGQNIKSLVCLCANCHFRSEFDDDPKKVNKSTTKSSNSVKVKKHKKHKKNKALASPKQRYLSKLAKHVLNSIKLNPLFGINIDEE